MIYRLFITLTASRIVERQRGLFRHHVRRRWGRLQRRRLVFLFPRNALLLTAVGRLIAFLITTGALSFLLSGHLRLVRPIPARLPQVNSVHRVSFPEI